MIILRRTFTILLLLASQSFIFAGTTGKIAGYVKDQETGDPLIGCNVLVEGTYLGAASDGTGAFFILNVPPGSYTVKAMMIGYTAKAITDVSVAIDLTTTVNFGLQQTAILGETVTVTYERPAIQNDRTSSDVHISEDVISELPVQDLNDILELQSGITKDAGGGIHVRGGRGSEVAYWVDGIPVTDSYDGSSAIEVDVNSIQELQLVSGTFNAEYGQAMSGIINIVTQTGGTKLNGSFDSHIGDYYSPNDKIMLGIDNYKPSATQNYSFSLSGPLVFEKLRFFLSERKYRSDGWLNGINYFTTTGMSGDSIIVPMNWQERSSFNGKLSLFLTRDMNLHFNTLISNREYQDYNHFFKWNPGGNPYRFDNGKNYSMSLNHIFSAKTFYTIKISKSLSEYTQYLYKNPLNSLYVHPDFLNVPGYTFSTGGTDQFHFYRNTNTSLFKFDFSTQLTPKNLVKFGSEYRSHDLELESFSIVAKRDEFGIEIEPFTPDTLDTSTPSHNYYYEKPDEFSLYIQDKLEYRMFIVNLGIRYDYFNSNSSVLADPSDPNIYYPFKQEHVNMTMEERKAIWYKDVTPKTSISPRLGLAFPITDQGVIHFSYGHFFQIPSFQYLYDNPGFKVLTSGGTYGVYGNADLKPQKTVMYELGLQQQLLSDLSLDITMFYRDIRDWVSTGAPIQTTLPGVTYVTYINRDYANSRGIVLSLRQNILNFAFVNIEYTYQIAEGSNSNPEEEYFSLQDNAEPTRQITPLDWDQRHTLNGALTINKKEWGGSLIGRYGSGYPYTPSYGISTRTGLSLASTLPSNSRRKPTTIEMDLKCSRSFSIPHFNGLIYVQIYNLFDTRNANNVFSDTGEPDYTTSASNVGRDIYSTNTVEEFIIYPDWYSTPREILLGIKLSF